MSKSKHGKNDNLIQNSNKDGGNLDAIDFNKFGILHNHTQTLLQNDKATLERFKSKINSKQKFDSQDRQSKIPKPEQQSVLIKHVGRKAKQQIDNSDPNKSVELTKVLDKIKNLSTDNEQLVEENRDLRQQIINGNEDHKLNSYNLKLKPKINASEANIQVKLNDFMAENHNLREKNAELQQLHAQIDQNYEQVKLENRDLKTRILHLERVVSLTSTTNRTPSRDAQELDNFANRSLQSSNDNINSTNIMENLNLLSAPSSNQITNKTNSQTHQRLLKKIAKNSPNPKIINQVLLKEKKKFVLTNMNEGNGENNNLNEVLQNRRQVKKQETYVNHFRTKSPGINLLPVSATVVKSKRQNDKGKNSINKMQHSSLHRNQNSMVDPTYEQILSKLKSQPKLAIPFNHKIPQDLGKINGNKGSSLSVLTKSKANLKSSESKSSTLENIITPSEKIEKSFHFSVIKKKSRPSSLAAVLNKVDKRPVVSPTPKLENKNYNMWNNKLSSLANMNNQMRQEIKDLEGQIKSLKK